MADQTQTAKLWTPRSVAGTQKICADWADTYEDDVTAMAYATPEQITAALRGLNVDPTQPVLDFGCGTGLSGAALARGGFTAIHGTDISPQMLGHASEKNHNKAPLYRHLWLSDPHHFNVETAAYGIIVATGVISLGAAGPDMLDVLLGALGPKGLLALSFNDPTLQDARYTDTLDAILTRGDATLMLREHGPHLNAQVTGSDVIVLRRA